MSDQDTPCPRQDCGHQLHWHDEFGCYHPAGWWEGLDDEPDQCACPGFDT